MQNSFIPTGRHMLSVWQAIEPVVDSSRYFALRLVDRASGRHAFIGLGFRCALSSLHFGLL